MRRALGVLALILLVVALAAVAGLVWGRSQLRGSLPQIDGERQIRGLAAPVRVTRDALGIPTVFATSRNDAARASGFLHAQDRFFQMDLSRRRAAGELAALVGARAVPIDREIRVHRFRAEAQRAVSLMSPADRELLDAYVAGVNAGLEALSAPPFEYLLLRQKPAPWRADDTLLVVLAMFVTLQDDDGSYEATLGTMHEVLPPAVVAFLVPDGSEWDAPVIGPAFHPAPIPGPDIYDLRARRTGKPQLPTPNSQLPSFEQANLGVERSETRNERSRDERLALGIGSWDLGIDDREREIAAVGSNNFVVAGRLTDSGRPLLANDMHLTIRVPNIWYRASLEWPEPTDAKQPHRLTGVTLPGVPAVVVGTNSHVAWGFTNAYADWSDIVLLDTDPARLNQYLTPAGWREFERHEETIEVAGGQPQRFTMPWTIWGPLLEPDSRGRLRAYRWVAHAAERLAASVTPMESARTVLEAFEEANGLGAPGQNIVAADSSGHIGWSIYGSIPRRTGFDGRTPVSWSDGSRGWDGWLSDAEYPRILDPEDGRIWTANARVVNGEMLAKLGDGSYEIGSRAHAIRDRLATHERFSVRDLLDIQLDTRAEFLARWRTLLLNVLGDAEVGTNNDRALLREIVDKGWSGYAAPDSAAYRFVRVFRELVSARVIAFVLSECYEADPTFNYMTVRRREAPIWQLVTMQPQHLLDPRYRTWSELLLASVDDTIKQSMANRGGNLRDRVWSEYNVVAYRHPLSDAIPFFGHWLDMPDASLPGDLYTPRMHWGAVGPSERMIVSPGDEGSGMMHMPTGQSGHPLSPFYANSHAPWAAGKPTPFLPGEAVHRLTLRP
jgi:penicillin G amidase